MQYINLTKHDINELISGLTIISTGFARVEAPSLYVGSDMNGVPMYIDNPNAVVIGLPEPKENTIYIVSSVMLNFIPDTRVDVVAPGNVVRDKQTWAALGCKGFKQKNRNPLTDRVSRDNEHNQPAGCGFRRAV